jgi:hypothetical protein
MNKQNLIDAGYDEGLVNNTPMSELIVMRAYRGKRYAVNNKAYHDVDKYETPIQGMLRKIRYVETRENQDGSVTHILDQFSRVYELTEKTNGFVTLKHRSNWIKNFMMARGMSEVEAAKAATTIYECRKKNESDFVYFYTPVIEEEEDNDGSVVLRNLTLFNDEKWDSAEFEMHRPDFTVTIYNGDIFASTDSITINGTNENWEQLFNEFKVVNVENQSETGIFIEEGKIVVKINADRVYAVLSFSIKLGRHGNVNIKKNLK